MSTRSVAFPLPRGEAQYGVSVAGFAAGFLFAGRSIFVLVTARWLNLGTELGVAISFCASAALVLAAGLQASGPSVHPVISTLRSTPVRWAIAYLTFAGISLLWTSSSSPASSALYWLALVADTLAVLLIARGTSSPVAATSILRGFIAASCLLALVAWIMPTAADLRLGDLEYFNTNQIANLCALSLLLRPLAWPAASTRAAAAAAILGVTLLRSLSKATLAAFIVAQLYRMLRDKAMSRARKLLLVAAAGVFMLLFSSLNDTYFTSYASSNQAESLTGRTVIWSWTFNAALEHPWLGNGFDAMWKIAPPFGGDLFEARHAENELLQQFFAYGAAGLVLLFGLYGSTLRAAHKAEDPALRLSLTAIVLYVAIRGIAEAEPFDLLLPLWLTATLAVLSSAVSNTAQFHPQNIALAIQPRRGTSL
jgi:O-antigen ligase